jgi:NADPH2 dehydrogenase
VSSGGNVAAAKIPLTPGYQVPFAARVKAGTKLSTRAVGLIAAPEQAEAIIAERQADFVAMARAFLDDARWVWHAAERLGAEISYPPQYARVSRAMWPGAALVRPAK